LVTTSVDFLNDADFYFQERFSAQEIFEKRRRRWPIRRNSDTKNWAMKKSIFRVKSAAEQHFCTPLKIVLSWVLRIDRCKQAER